MRVCSHKLLAAEPVYTQISMFRTACIYFDNIKSRYYIQDSTNVIGGPKELQIPSERFQRPRALRRSRKSAGIFQPPLGPSERSRKLVIPEQFYTIFSQGIRSLPSLPADLGPSKPLVSTLKVCQETSHFADELEAR